MDRLNSIGFVWDIRLVDWDIRYKQLVEYKRTHGNCSVPRKYELNKELGRWVSNQVRHKCGDSLHKDRIAKLESIGFVWGRRLADWHNRFEQLVEYKRTHGNCGVPSHYQSNLELGRWVSLQRLLEVKNSLSKDRVARLESIGFTFGAGHEANKSDDWDSFFEELRDYLRNHAGDCNVPEPYRLNPSLGEWVNKQRHDYSLKCGGDQSAMTPEHEAKLNVLGFLWVKTKSSVGSKDNNNLLSPDKVTSKLLPMNRQRTSFAISTEVRSNDTSWRSGDHEGEPSSPAADFKKRRVG
jgi:hypothetical protein